MSRAADTVIPQWQLLEGSQMCAPVSVLLTLECGQVFGWNRNVKELLSSGDTSPGKKRKRVEVLPSASPGSPTKRRKTSAPVAGVSPKAVGASISSSQSALLAFSGMSGSEDTVFQPIEYAGVLRLHDHTSGKLEESYSLVGLRTAQKGSGIEYMAYNGTLRAVEESLRRLFRVGETMPLLGKGGLEADSAPMQAHKASVDAYTMRLSAASSGVGGDVRLGATGSSRGSSSSGGNSQDVMASLVQSWGEADERHKAVTTCLPGLRVLRQDPVECLFSFICSSNNNIPRINLILARIRARYGKLVGELAGQEYYSFPTIEALAKAEEADLRAIGLGYRARFIRETAQHLLAKGGRRYLEGLARLPVSAESRVQVQEALCECVGVGRKVADCVALFSLGRCDTVPVDTHVWAMACRDFEAEAKAEGGAGSGIGAGAGVREKGEVTTEVAIGASFVADDSSSSSSSSDATPAVAAPTSPAGRKAKGKKGKKEVALLRTSEELRAAVSLTPRVYESVGELFRARYGTHAGWAHCALFAAELPAFRRWLPPEMAADIAKFEVEERERSRERKAAAKARTAARKAAKATSTRSASDGPSAGGGGTVEEGGSS